MGLEKKNSRGLSSLKEEKSFSFILFKIKQKNVPNLAETTNLLDNKGFRIMDKLASNGTIPIIGN